MKSSNRIAALILAIALTGTGCVYRADIQQGNEITEEMVVSLSQGMHKDDVIDVMGNPLITDPFHRDRWDYYYFKKDGKTGNIIRHRLTIEFAEDRISRLESALQKAE